MYLCVLKYFKSRKLVFLVVLINPAAQEETIQYLNQ